MFCNTLSATNYHATAIAERISHERDHLHKSRHRHTDSTITASAALTPSKLCRRVILFDVTSASPSNSPEDGKETLTRLWLNFHTRAPRTTEEQARCTERIAASVIMRTPISSRDVNRNFAIF